MGASAYIPMLKIIAPAYAKMVAATDVPLLGAQYSFFSRW